MQPAAGTRLKLISIGEMAESLLLSTFGTVRCGSDHGSFFGMLQYHGILHGRKWCTWDITNANIARGGSVNGLDHVCHADHGLFGFVFIYSMTFSNV